MFFDMGSIKRIKLTLAQLAVVAFSSFFSAKEEVSFLRQENVI
jgi:hypothetical protein